MTAPRRAVVDIEGQQLTTASWGDGAPGVIVLHDGLGSIAQWRGVPAALSRVTGRTVLAYDRAGHGRSTPVPTGAWPADWLHREAEVLARLIEAVGAADPVLVGHSDGGSIAAIHAAASGTRAPVALLAAHTWVEDVTVDRITVLERRPVEMVQALSRFHDAPEALFRAWSGVWTSPEFARWDIRPDLHRVVAPTLVIQGTRDEYATPDHALETAAAIGDNAECRLLPDLGHLLQHQDPGQVVELVASFVGRTVKPADS